MCCKLAGDGASVCLRESESISVCLLRSTEVIKKKNIQRCNISRLKSKFTSAHRAHAVLSRCLSDVRSPSRSSPGVFTPTRVNEGFCCDSWNSRKSNQDGFSEFYYV